MKRLILAVMACIFPATPLLAAHTEAPVWMHALINVPLPAHDEKTDAVLLYSEENVTVESTDKIKYTIREAYKILRPGGRRFGTVLVPFDSSYTKVTGIRGWCIPAEGKDYEVRDKDSAVINLRGIEGSELIDDVKDKIIEIPAPDPGNIIGYEYELEEHPLLLQDSWNFQEAVPVRESHYSLNLPPGWEYKALWLNYPEVQPTQNGSGQWQWSLKDVKEIRKEEDMPPLEGVSGQMLVSFFPPGGAPANSFSNWRDLGRWYFHLASGRSDASPEIKQQVAALTASAPTPVAKMRAIAQFVQHDIRYVAIELGIGGWQPHPAPQIYTHRYGDCKDKATLMITMLREIGVDAYDVRISVERGGVTPSTPAHLAFDHAITAIKLPEGVDDLSLIATLQHPRLGKLLFFDPTDDLTPFGQIRGSLQANYGLLTTPEGGELVELPQQPSAASGVRRTGKLTLNASGTLQGDVEEMYVGDRAWAQRYMLTRVQKSADEIKPVESLLADSLSTYLFNGAKVSNAQQKDLPFIWNFSFQAFNYAKNAGNLLLVRPRVLGIKSRGLLETPEPRRFPVEFPGPAQDTDRFEITLPPGYEVDDLPADVNANFSFASYHSKTEVAGRVLRYTRTFEIKELSVPVSKAEELRKFYRIVATDERNTAVLKAAP
jgi:hypothetical protein